MIVYCVYRNSDMTEGRGPDVLDQIFLNRSDAVKYMDAQPGCMGRRMKWSESKSAGDWHLREFVCHEKEYNPF